MIFIKGIEITHPPRRLMTKSMKAITPAVIGFTRPEARGRFRLIGCRWSSFRSFKSLKTYTDPVRRQKRQKASRVLINSGQFNKFWEKSKGANKAPFLIHCLGRREEKRALRRVNGLLFLPFFSFNNLFFPHWHFPLGILKIY
jgi:hypothetical protein